MIDAKLSCDLILWKGKARWKGIRADQRVPWAMTGNPFLFSRKSEDKIRLCVPYAVLSNGGEDMIYYKIQKVVYRDFPFNCSLTFPNPFGTISKIFRSDRSTNSTFSLLLLFAGGNFTSTMAASAIAVVEMFSSAAAVGEDEGISTERLRLWESIMIMLKKAKRFDNKEKKKKKTKKKCG